jgi:hypothetical protein
MKRAVKIAKKASVAKPTPTKKEAKLDLDLLNNGIDFIQSGVRYFLHDEPDPASHKYAVLHLFSGFLLLLKERLRREHPSLIFKDVKDVTKPYGKTVDYDEALLRLEHCAGVKFDEKALRTLRTAHGLRNLAEHYKFTIDLRHAQAVIGELSELIYLFMRDQLGMYLSRHVQAEVWERMQHLRRIAKRLEVDEAEDWNRRAAKYSDLNDEELSEIANSIEAYHPKHHPDPDEFLECPQCSEETLVQTDGDIGVCTNPECRDVCEITRCWRCSDRITDGSMLCFGCNDYIDRQ